MVFKTYYRLMQVKSIAECSNHLATIYHYKGLVNLQKSFLKTPID